MAVTMKATMMIEIGYTIADLILPFRAMAFSL